MENFVEEIVAELIKQGYNSCENYGPILNAIQDVAAVAVSTRAWNAYVAMSNNDIEECEDMDGIMIHGDYYDWKEASVRKWDHVRSWCKYFNSDNQKKILEELQATAAKC